MKKVFTLFALCISLFFLLSCSPKQEESEMDKLADLWRHIYGSNRIVKLPDREDTYALLWQIGQDDEIWWGDDLRLETFYPSSYPPWDNIYTGDKCSLVVHPGDIYPGDSIPMTLVNNIGRSPITSDNYQLDILIDGVWYPVFSPYRGSDLRAVEHSSASSLELDVQIGDILAEATMLSYEFDEETKKYVRSLPGPRDLQLIPGHYRFLLPVSFYDPDEHYNLMCEFDIVEP
ncbi:MAG: hypothetical protein IKL27_07750 [Oscillospiraceae bacterium]|nr:hypothetical protein [Oscillospiraceae bacterium]